MIIIEKILYRTKHGDFHAAITRSDKKSGDYRVDIYNDHDRLMGRVDFFVYGGQAWLASISVIKDYRYQGVGQALIEMCEYIVAKRGATVISGLYSPSNDYAQQFYIKNGYDIIQRDDDLLIQKDINIAKTRALYAMKISNKDIKEDTI